MKLDFRRKAPFVSGTFALVLVSLAPDAQPQSTEPLDVDAVVLQLRGLPLELYPGPMSHLCNPALAYPSTNVRGFARLAIAKIGAVAP